MIAKKLVFSGHVQGVGFRYRTLQLAQQFAVVGTVQNLKDGTVELKAQGSDEELQRFFSSLKETMSKNIRNVESRDIPTFDSNTFEILS
ncbi:acylphosphatase [Pseudobacteriovorax antillogorgiicola]|uniref:acylphosphatase n=1 Tax=Pseudobacteriovorax antillogorgiicola TaxID=1513793 RepID=A0A1Y6C6I3_9BACT|nr:acylphosphatase [Pseudobacteriovorax antillogorgiicola]TCS49327.1 acylphosphatase [Pseudobacteriovorax antillogorgiicola]SMF48042.1 acylphosphatase [Pseudobacteriovorax antillogorgiicola]